MNWTCAEFNKCGDVTDEAVTQLTTLPRNESRLNCLFAAWSLHGLEDRRCLEFGARSFCGGCASWSLAACCLYHPDRLRSSVAVKPARRASFISLLHPSVNNCQQLEATNNNIQAIYKTRHKLPWTVVAILVDHRL